MVIVMMVISRDRKLPTTRAIPTCTATPLSLMSPLDGNIIGGKT